MPNVMMTFVKAIFVPATLVEILGISADNEPMLTTLIGPNFLGALIILDQNLFELHFWAKLVFKLVVKKITQAKI